LMSKDRPPRGGLVVSVLPTNFFCRQSEPDLVRCILLSGSAYPRCVGYHGRAARSSDTTPAPAMPRWAGNESLGEKAFDARSGKR
jgi:hypothetical protein